MKPRYKVTEKGNDEQVYWITLEEKTILQYSGGELILERVNTDEIPTAIQATNTIFPYADFQDASLTEITNFIRSVSNEINPPGLNIIVLPPLAGSPIIGDFNFRNISAYSLINYITEATSTVASYEEEAIVIRSVTSQ